MLDEHDIKKIIAEHIGEGQRATFKQKVQKKKMQFSKKIVMFSCVMYACTWAACIAAWFLYGTYPEEFISLATWLFGSSLAFYGAKACIENKAKIDSGYME